MYGDQTEKCLQNCGYVVWDIPTESPSSQIHISRIIAKVKGVFKSSFLYFLLFLTSHKLNFLKVKANSSVPMDSTL